MAEERTLGLARVQDRSTEEPSKEELQRRLDEARGSISNTVTEIKESVANQVQAVKETLDWREQFKKRPVIWSAGAAGAGFLVGYGLAAMVKGEQEEDLDDSYTRRSYAAGPVLGEPGPSLKSSDNGHDEDTGPSFFQRLTNSHAYEKVRDEAGSVGDAFLQELTKTAKVLVVPAVVKSIRDFLGGYLPKSEAEQSQDRSKERPQSAANSAYQPVLERNQS